MGLAGVRDGVKGGTLGFGMGSIGYWFGIEAVMIRWSRYRDREDGMRDRLDTLLLVSVSTSHIVTWVACAADERGKERYRSAIDRRKDFNWVSWSEKSLGQYYCASMFIQVVSGAKCLYR